MRTCECLKNMDCSVHEGHALLTILELPGGRICDILEFKINAKDEVRHFSPHFIFREAIRYIMGAFGGPGRLKREFQNVLDVYAKHEVRHFAPHFVFREAILGPLVP